MYTRKIMACCAAFPVIFLILALLWVPVLDTLATALLPGFYPLGSGTMDIVTAVDVDDVSGDVYAGGDFRLAGGVAVEHIARWDGSTWSALGSGLSSASGLAVNAVQVDSHNGYVYVGGNFTSAGGLPANNIACWNGSGWSALGSGINGTVNTLAFAPNGTLVVGGDFKLAGGKTANHIAQWNGSSWKNLGDGVGGYVYAVAVAANGDVYAAGQFTTAGDGVAVDNIARWNGVSWSAVGASGANTSNGIDMPSISAIRALVIDDVGNLYAGGDFGVIAGTAAANIARWNGSSWSALGAGLNGSVLTLSIDSAGSLYAGGWFTQAGDVPVSYFARWHGGSWFSQGEVGNSVRSLSAGPQGDVFLGGSFTQVGGVAAAFIARQMDASVLATQTAVAASLTASAPTKTPTLTPSSTPTQTASPTPTATAKPTERRVYLPWIARGQTACLSEEQEPNNIASEANPACPGKSIQGQHDGDAGTGDLFELQLSAGQIVAIGLETAEDTGVQLLLYRDDGSSLVMEKQDTLAPFEIDYAAPAAGQYLVYVFSDPAAGNTARYTLQIAGQAAGAAFSNGEVLATPPAVGR